MALGRAKLGTLGLCCAGMLAVHELRCGRGYAGDGQTEMARHGHAYLSPLAPLAGLALLVALTHIVARLARGRAAGASSAGLAFWRVWLLSVVLLLGAYSVQESLEGALASGHPAGLEGVFGHGGWVAVPAAMAIAALLAFALRAGQVAPGLPLELAVLRSGPCAAPSPGAPVLLATADAIARNLAARGPPAIRR